MTVTRQGETDTFLWLSDTELEFALLALAGSLPEVNCITFKAGDWLEAIEQQPDWNYDLSVRGLLHISQSTELDGFEDMGELHSILSAREGQTGVFHQEFRVEVERQG